jgi:hypothetical protein
LKPLNRPIAVLAALLLGFPALARPATTVEPVLSGAVTWTREGNPYRIVQDTRLPSGSSLVLQPGVVIEMAVRSDASVPGGTPAVDFIVQGDLEVLGNDFAPVSMVPDRPAQWGALYILPTRPRTWTSFHLVGGQLILARGELDLNACRVSQGRGIALMEGAVLRAENCQFDENKTGLLFLNAQASARLVRTRLKQNEVGFFFRAAGTLEAEGSSVYGSGRYHAANTSADMVVLPALWWGTSDGKKIMRKVLDGRSKRGYGQFQFTQQLLKDPMSADIKGFVPEGGPSRDRRSGPRFLAGPVFQMVLPQLNIQGADMEPTLGYGLHLGTVIQRDLEVRGKFQTVALNAMNEERRSALHLNLARMGLTGHKQFALDKGRRVFLFAEAGGLLALTRQDLTRPQDPMVVTTPLVNKRTSETNLNITAGAGAEFQVGKHRVEVGIHYELVPLNDDRGGALIPLQGALNLYF